MLTVNNALVRLYASCSILVTVGIAAADRHSRHFEAMQTDGAQGYVAMIVLGTLALFGVLDVVINDWFPDRIRWRFPHKHRHLIYMLMAMGMVGMTLAVAQMGAIAPFIARYLLDAFFSVYIAIKGVQSHYVQRIRACQ
jgi:MFS family permease